MKQRILIILLTFAPVANAANPFQAMPEGLISLLQGGVLISIAVLSCIFIGILGYFSRWSWERIGGWMMASIFVFGAVAIVNLVAGWLGGA